MYFQAVLLLIPSAKAGLGLTDVQVGLIGTARTISGAPINIPAGAMADMWRSRVSLILTSSLASLALGYLLVGAFSSYWLLLLGVAVIGLGNSIWNAPGFGTLAAVYPDRRATAMAVHRMGGAIGDSASPITMGLLLGGFAFWGLEWGGLEWRALALVLVIPAMIGAAFVLLGGRQLETTGTGTSNLVAYLRSALPLLTNGTVVSMVVLASVRAMAHNALSIFLVIYMSEDLAFPDFKIGYHVTLLTLFGIVFAPVMGWASDRVGRRPVIFAGLGAFSMLVFCLPFFGTGWSFTIILACLGMVVHAVQPVMLATALDAARRGTESSGIALMFTGQAILAAISPVIAGWLRELYGMDGVFYYAATIVGMLTLASLFVPMRKVQERPI